MKKPRKQPSEPVSWAVYIMRSETPQWVGSVQARDEEEARAKAIRELTIKPVDYLRIVVRRE